MATALSAQLQALAASNGHAIKQRPGARPSLLFDPVQAADVDVQTIFSLAASGLEELARIDGQFEAYRKTLLSPQSCQTDRDLQTKQFNDRLNQSIGDYLRLLSTYIMLTPAQQTFEYLIRLYKVQEHNVEEVMACILPYHETGLFVQIVKLLHIEGTKWEFLQGVQKTGAPPPRVALVQRCSHNVAVLEAICESAMVVSGSSKSSKLITFSTVVITETLAAVSSVTTELVNRFLPYILRSFEGGVCEEFQVGALMIICTLASKCSLSEALIAALFESITRRLQKQQETDSPLLQLSIRALVILTQTQQIDQLPIKGFKFLVKVRELPTLLRELGHKFETGKFLSLLLKSLAEHCTVHEHYELALLQVIKVVPIRGLVRQLVSGLVHLFRQQQAKHGTECEGDTSAIQLKAKSVVTRLLRAIESQYPQEMDFAINLLLKEDNDRTGGNSFFDLAQDMLQGSLHKPLAKTHTSLLLSLDHSEARVRQAALESLSELVPQYVEGEQMSSVVTEALLKRIHDDDFGVLRAVLTIGDLVKILPPRDLFEALSSLLTRCNKNLHGEAKFIAKISVQLLACEFGERNPGYAEQVAFVLLQYLLILPKTWKFNWTVLKLCQKFPFPLFTNLASINAVPPEAKVDGGSANTRKQNLRAWLSPINSKTISAMSTSLVNNVAVLLPLLAKAVSEVEPARPLVMLVLLHSLYTERNELLVHSRDYLTLLSREWDAVQSDENFAGLQLLKIDYLSWDLGSLCSHELYDRLESTPLLVYVELLLRCLYKLLDQGFRKFKDSTEEVPEIVADLFVLFARSSSDGAFEPHMTLLTKLLSTRVSRFWPRFFQVQESVVPAKVQVRALDLLASQFSSVSRSSKGTPRRSQSPKELESSYVQSVLAMLLVVLANPAKAVRQRGLGCLKQLCTLVTDGRKLLISDQGIRRGVPVLQSDLFAKFVEALTEHEKVFLADGNYLPLFITHALGAVQEPSQKDSANALEERFDAGARKSLVTFLAAHARSMCGHPQRVLLSSLLGAEHVMELASETSDLLSRLLQRRRLGHLENDSSSQEQRLSNEDVQLICLLLQVYTPHVARVVASSPVRDDGLTLSGVFEALTVEGGSSADPAVEQPCLTAIRCLTPQFFRALEVPSQDHIFQTLISLSTHNGGAVRAAAREAVRHLQVSSHFLIKHVLCLTGEHLTKPKDKRIKLLQGTSRQPMRDWPEGGMIVNNASALLEFLLGLPGDSDRYLLLEPLFKLLGVLMSGMWPGGLDDGGQKEANLSATESLDSSLSTVTYVHQLTLMILENITRSISDEDLVKANAREKISAGYDIDLVVRCVSMATDGATRNHALALLTAAGKLYPQKILNHVIQIVAVVGESVVTQDFGQSHEVVYQILATIVPAWLESTQTPAELFKVFVDALPNVPAHRRLALVTNLLRVTTEDVGLHNFLWLLIQSFVKTCMKEGKESGSISQDEQDRWQLKFAAELCEQYPSAIQLPAFVKLLAISRTNDTVVNSRESGSKTEVKQFWSTQQTTTTFVAEQLQGSDLLAPEKECILQDAYIGLMEQVLLQLQLSGGSSAAASHSHRLRKGAHEAAYSLLDVLVDLMAPATFTKSITSLLKHPDTRIRRKVLRLFTSKMVRLDQTIDLKKGKTKALRDKERSNMVFDFGDSDLHDTMVTEIMGVLAETGEDVSLSTKHAAIRALDLYAQRYHGSSFEIFVSCIPALVANFETSSKSLGAAAVHCVASIFRLLGPEALPALPDTVHEILKTAERLRVKKNDVNESDSDDVSKMCLAILVAIQAMVEKLGLFLSPYLHDILGVVILQQEFVISSNVDVTTSVTALRMLLSEKIPARLLLDPLVNSYEKALASGEVSTAALFRMVAQLASNLDRNSVVSYHSKIFSLCILALDLRRKSPASLSSVNNVETEVVGALVALVMKLGESTFRPLFIKTMEWAQSTSIDGTDVTGYNIHRSIVFYRLVNELAAKLRSLFVPYFRYFLEGCVYQLISGKTVEEAKVANPKKKRKQVNDEMVSPPEWHVRVLVVSALQKCFLYDTVSFLDAPKFQLLLKPLVLQLGVGSPMSSEDLVDIPTEKDMDDILVSCLGHMALAAGTDLLWQQLNHEVLMQTRSDNVRTRLLGLQVIGFLVQRLREEYLVLLPETIAFLAELLEDPQLSVVAKTQELMKTLEELSGEDLKQYL